MTCYGKLTSSVSQDWNSAKKSSKNVTVAQLDDQTCPPPIPYFSWRPFSHLDLFSKVKSYLRELLFPISHFAWMLFSPVGFVHKVILYLWEQIFLFVTKAILIMPRKQLHSTYFLSLAATDAMWIFSPVPKSYMKIYSHRFLSWRSGGDCHNHSRVTMLHMMHLMTSCWCRQYLEQDNYSLARRSGGPNLQATKQNLRSTPCQGRINEE